MVLPSVGFSRVPVSTHGNRRLVGMWRMFRNPRILGIAGLVLSAFIVMILNATTFSPENKVLRYLTALEDGRTADAIALVTDDPAVAASIGGLPDDPALRPRNIEVLGAHNDEGITVVDARAVLDGATVDLQFSFLEAVDWSPLADWRFVGKPVAPVNVITNGAAPVALGGVVGARYALVPSAVVVTSGSAWFDFSPHVVMARALGVPVSTTVEPVASTALLTEVDSAVRDYLDACAAQKTLVPAECPFAGFAFEKIAKGPNWGIETYPTIEISHSDGEWSVYGKGKARLKVSLVDFATEKTTKYSESVPYVIKGTIADLDTATPRLEVQNTVKR